MEEQEQLRERIKPYLNNINSLAKKWDVRPDYFFKWYKGLPVGNATLDKIRTGVKELTS